MTNATAAKGAREKAAAMRAEAAAKDARRRQLVIGVSAVAVILLVVSIFAVVKSARDSAALKAAKVPANITAQNGIVVGNSSAKVTIVAYEDFQCSACEQFEQESGAQISKWIADGTVKVEYRPISFLDNASLNQYSSRALNLAGAVVDTHPDLFKKVHDALYLAQPKEGSAGPENPALIATAVAQGVPEADIAAAVNGGAFNGWVKKATDASAKSGIHETPTLYVNGRKLEGTAGDGTVRASHDLASLTKAVEAALKG